MRGHIVATRQIDWSIKRLAIDPERACQSIEELLQHKVQEMRKDGILIGLSGGLDSAVVAYLSVRAMGREKVNLLNLPDRDSKSIHQEHAALIAQDLGIQLRTQEITPVLQAMKVYELLPIASMPGKMVRETVVRMAKSLVDLRRSDDALAARFHPKPSSMLAKGNAYAISKHRVRANLLYYQADLLNLMVVGAANKTELLTGTFAKWGCDHCADVMPVMHLYRTQIEALAEYLGVPEVVRTKAADPDVLAGMDNKEALLGSFQEADQILWGLEHGVERADLVDAFGEATVARLANLRELSRSMREVPYVVSGDGLP